MTRQEQELSYEAISNLKWAMFDIQKAYQICQMLKLNTDDLQQAFDTVQEKRNLMLKQFGGQQADESTNGNQGG